MRLIEPNRSTNFSKFFILEWNSIHFGQFLCPSSGVFHCTHSNGICHTDLLTAIEQDQDGTWVPSWSCSQAVCKPVWHIPLLCVQQTTPDDGQTEELSEMYRVSFQNKKCWEISASSWFYYKKFIMMHSHMNVKLGITFFLYTRLFATWRRWSNGTRSQRHYHEHSHIMWFWLLQTSQFLMKRHKFRENWQVA
jgi:hypothetical protein